MPYAYCCNQIRKAKDTQIKEHQHVDQDFSAEVCHGRIPSNEFFIHPAVKPNQWSYG